MIEKLQEKLIIAARNHPPNERVPYAFENRIMASLATARPHDSISVWSGLLWRAALPCLALMLATAAWSAFSPSVSEAEGTDLEYAVLEPVHVAITESW